MEEKNDRAVLGARGLVRVVTGLCPVPPGRGATLQHNSVWM